MKQHPEAAKGQAKKTVLVVGLGRFGFALCERLAALGQHVVAVDKVRALVEDVSDFVELSAQLDATDEDALAKVGAKDADVAVVSIGENLEASVLATAILRGMGVPQVVARAQNALHARVLAKVGAHRVIFPERDMGIRVADLFVFPWLTQFSPLPGSEYLVGSLAPLPEMVGKSLVELDFRNRYNAVVLLINRQGSQFLPSAATIIEVEDVLLIAARQKDVEPWANRLYEEGGDEA
jgi:trk system potassium uptake protein TrkA